MTAEFEAWGACGAEHYRVFDLGARDVVAEHLHRWATRAARTSRCWFAAGPRTLVIEYADDRNPTDLRF